MSSRKSGKRPARQLESRWTWDEQPQWSAERQDWYYVARNEQGEVHYQWQNERHGEPATPRTIQFDLNQRGLAAVDLSGNYDEAVPGGGDGYNLTTQPSGGESKGKTTYYGATDDGEGSGEGSGGDGGGAWPTNPLLGRNDAAVGASHDQNALPDQGYSSHYRYDEAQEIQQALVASSETYAAPQQGDYEAYPQAQPGPSSAPYGDNLDHVDAYDGEALTTQNDNSITTLPVIRGTAGEVEPADARFRIRHSSEFQPGRVFKVLWADPMGRSGRPPRPLPGNFTENTNIFTAGGEQFHAKYRPFIIVANDEGHATCVPIYTYMRQGCAKPGVKPKQHGIIHERSTDPIHMTGESRLGIEPVRMEMSPDVPGERLDVASRVAYSELTTVKHNVKVMFIGSVVREDFDRIFRPGINTVWEQKRHEPQPDHHRERQHGRSARHRRHGGR